MKNLRRTKNAQISIALPVPANAVTGQVVPLGASGLRGVLVTARATAETIQNGKSAPGLHEGEATVELIGVHTTITVAVAAATVQFAAIYVDANNVYSTNDSGTRCGAAITGTTGPGSIEVALF